MTRCPCGKRARPGQRWCLGCHARYMAQWRKTHPLTGLARMKQNCRAYAHQYLRRGKLKEEKCEVCGGKAQMHHDDYSKPLEVRWLCRKDHLILDAPKMRQGHSSPGKTEKRTP